MCVAACAFRVGTYGDDPKADEKRETEWNKWPSE